MKKGYIIAFVVILFVGIAIYYYTKNKKVLKSTPKNLDMPEFTTDQKTDGRGRA